MLNLHALFLGASYLYLCWTFYFIIFISFHLCEMFLALLYCIIYTQFDLWKNILWIKKKNIRIPSTSVLEFWGWLGSWLCLSHYYSKCSFLLNTVLFESWSAVLNLPASVAAHCRATRSRIYSQDRLGPHPTSLALSLPGMPCSKSLWAAIVLCSAIGKRANHWESVIEPTYGKIGFIINHFVYICSFQLPIDKFKWGLAVYHRQPCPSNGPRPYYLHPQFY